MAAVELSCSKLASGCCIQPKTSMCSKSAPSNLRTRRMAPVSLASTLARWVRMWLMAVSTCVRVVIRRLLLLMMCQVPESLHTKIGVNKGESEGDVPQQTDSVSDTLDSHEAAFDCKNCSRLQLPAEILPASDRDGARLQR